MVISSQHGPFDARESLDECQQAQESGLFHLESTVFHYYFLHAFKYSPFIMYVEKCDKCMRRNTVLQFDRAH